MINVDGLFFFFLSKNRQGRTGQGGEREDQDTIDE